MKKPLALLLYLKTILNNVPIDLFWRKNAIKLNKLKKNEDCALKGSDW